jgi:hypothetical protein
MIAARPSVFHNEAGLTLIELLIGLVVGMVVTLAAFALLEFTTNDVSRITARTHATQVARIQVEKLMLQLHSACVAVTINPILVGSNANELKFITETSPLNPNKEPVASLTSVQLHKIIYTPPSGKVEGLLTEQSWRSTATSISPEFLFAEGEKPTERRLLKGVTRTINAKGEESPVFQYYRYYRETDTTPLLGQLYPTGVAPSTSAEAERIAKVTVGFTVTPEGAEGRFAKGDRSFAIEDSAVLRLAPSSEATASPNEPCAQL